jgi:RNA polymerase sigma-70 factor (ECF subfamily)
VPDGPETGLASPSALFERYGAAVYRRCLRLLGDEARARAAVQDVFTAVLGELERAPRGGVSPLVWLFGIATRRCLALRQASEADAPPKAGLERLLSELDLEGQQIVMLRHLDRMRVAEVAAAVGVTETTVEARLLAFRASAGRELLEAQGSIAPPPPGDGTGG